MKHIVFALTATAALIISSPVVASEDANCGDAPKSEWLSEADIKAKATDMGYAVRGLKIEDGCYEIYATKEGKRLEVYFNPVTAVVVRTEEDD